MFEERGQTTQDYILGVSIMLVSVLFVFGYVPNVFDAYESPVSSVEESQADRAAEYLMANYSLDGNRTVMKFDEPGGIERVLSRDEGMAAFREGASLDTQTNETARPNVNVIIAGTDNITQEGRPGPIVLDNGEKLAYGQQLDTDTAVASKTRVILLNETSTNYCRPTCWMIVRVW